MNSIGPGLAFLLLIAPPLIWAYLRPRRWRGRFEAADRVIFPSSTIFQVAAVFVAFVLSLFLFYGLATDEHLEAGVYIVLGVFLLTAFSVLFRQVELDEQGLTLRHFGFKKQMRWSEIQSAHRLSDGSWLLLGGFRRMKIDRYYCDFELLILAVARRLEGQRTPSERLSFEDSCRRLQESGLLAAGPLPIFPERLPQHDDPENYGVQFFRTNLDHAADLSNLSLARCFIGRCEVRGTSFVNSDLRQSNLCWSNFSHVDFTGAILAGSDMRSSHFLEVRFTRANLRGADLRLSSFERCDFADANLENAILSRDQDAKLTLSEAQRAQIDWRDEPGREPPGG